MAVSSPTGATDPFDVHAAVRLASALDELTARFDSLARREVDAGVGVTRDWAGFTRRWFDGCHGDLVRTLHAVAGAAATDAALVRQAIAFAQAAQAGQPTVHP